MPYTTEDLFRELDGENFSSYWDLEAKVIELFNEHLWDFPPGYTYRNAIARADEKGWLEPKKGRFAVRVESVPA